MIFSYLAFISSTKTKAAGIFTKWKKYEQLYWFCIGWPLMLAVVFNWLTGGLGFTMGFPVSMDTACTGFGQRLSAVYLIPKVSHLGHKYKHFPQIFGHFYDGRVALLADYLWWICRLYWFIVFGWSQISFCNS
jgi:hypothetical protein